MSLSQDIDNGLEVYVFAVITVRANPTAWTLETSLGGGTNVYSTPLNPAKSVSFFKRNSTTFTAHSSLAGFASPTASKYFFDISDMKLYVDFTSVLPITGTEFFSTEYQIYVSNQEVIHYSDPLNASSNLISWEPRIMGMPSLSKGISDGIFGFQPQITSSITLQNNDYELSKLLKVGTLPSLPIKIYITSKNRLVADTSLLFDGRIDSVTYGASNISISFTDQKLNFSGTDAAIYSGASVFSVANYPLIDPEYEDSLIPTIYGIVDGHEAVNISYQEGFSAGTQNRTYVVAKFPTGYSLSGHKRSYIVQSSPAPTASRIYLNTVDGLNAGDVIYSTTQAKQWVITAVGSGYVDGNNLSNTFAAVTPIAGGETLVRDVVGHVRIEYNGAPPPYDEPEPMYGASPEVFTSFTSNELRLNFRTSDRTEPAPDIKIIVRVYGLIITTPYTSNLTFSTAIKSKWHQILFHYLTNHVGISSSLINQNTFISYEALPSKHNDIGFVLPKAKSTTYSTHLENIKQIVATRFCSIFQNSDGLVDIYDPSPYGPAAYSFTPDDVFEGSIDYEERYSSLSKSVIINYRPTQWRDRFGLNVPGSNSYFYDIDTEFQTVSLNDAGGLWVAHYQGSATQNIDSLSYYTAQTAAQAAKAMTIFGYPQNYLKVQVGLANYQMDIGDIVEVFSPGLPGSNDPSATDTFKGIITDIKLDSSGLSITIWDQIGIQQNQGVW